VEASAASVALAAEAETLARLIGQFRVDAEAAPPQGREVRAARAA
jgi:hypothetical protein